ncbi:hypothetical protein [Negadavirga shengliensis]|uniref:Uncharacterized protein n=1 Tax=Negadavirga shengliensis TaxID=1389218 RepID=A0ABV9T1M5_9BACT
MISNDHNTTIIRLNIAFPDLMVKTYHGNVRLKSLVKNQRAIVYTNPIDLIPGTEEEKMQLMESLEALKKLNCLLIGFSRRTFKDHLTSLNWVNSYLKEDLVFPIFFQPGQFDENLKNYFPTDGEEIVDPVYFVENNGMTKIMLNGKNKNNRRLTKVLDIAGRLVLSDQQFSPHAPEKVEN